MQVCETDLHDNHLVVVKHGQEFLHFVEHWQRFAFGEDVLEFVGVRFSGERIGVMVLHTTLNQPRRKRAASIRVSTTHQSMDDLGCGDFARDHTIQRVCSRDRSI